MIIGFLHLALGALDVVGAGVGLLGAAALSPLLLIPVVVKLLLGLASCYAGLLINDGRRRGAVVAIAVHVVEAALLILAGTWSTTLAFTVFLLVAAGWLLPQLSGDAELASTESRP